MLSEGEALFNLDLPAIPQWRSDGRAYTLAENNLGEVRLTVYKSADRLIHVHVVTAQGSLAARTDEGVSVEPKRQPLPLTLRWSTEGIVLLLDKQQSMQLLWRKTPLPPRP